MSERTGYLQTRRAELGRRPRAANCALSDRERRCVGVVNVRRCCIHPLAAWVALLSLGVGSGCDPDPHQDLEITLRVETPIGFPGNINTADLNHDGSPDLAVVNFLDDNFSVALNNGDGTFAAPVRYELGGQQPSYIATADFNGDGHVDVALSNAVTSDASVLLGNGDGTFQPAHEYSLSRSLLQLGLVPFSLETGDFNHDGKADIVASNSGTNNISVLLGNGDGTFQQARLYPLLTLKTVGGIPFALTVGDFDEDGNPDLLTGGAYGATVLKGKSDGKFAAHEDYGTGFAMSCAHTADFDFDGHLDVATNHWGSNFAILLGDGHGAFSLGDWGLSGGVMGECFGVGDLNGDGKHDLALVNTLGGIGNGNVAIRLGNGDGTFGAPAAYPVGHAPWAASIVDLNGDGKADVAVCNGLETTVSVFLGNGDGSLQPSAAYPM
jgi:hypothetical protein